MNEQRKNIRYKTQAGARIPGILESGAFLRDLSVTGCSLESTSLIDLKQGAVYTIEVIPEGTSEIKSFELQAEARWVRSQHDFCEAGFMITASPVKKEFERYVDYLVWRSETV